MPDGAPSTGGFDFLKFELEVDPASMQAALAAVDAQLRGVAQDRTANVDVDVDTAEAVAGGAVLDFAARDRTATIRAEVDGDNAERASRSLLGSVLRLGDAFGTVASAGGGMARTIGSTVAGAFGGLISMFSRLLVSITLVMLAMPFLISLLNTLAGGFFALASSMAPAVGVLATLPGIMAGVGAGFAAVIIGSQGVFQAFSAGQKATEGMAAAQRDLAASTRAIDEAMREHAAALEALREARASYAEDVSDASLANRAAAVAEERAIYNLEQAQKRLAEARRGVMDVSYDMTKETDAFTGKVYEVATATNDSSRQAGDLRDAILGLKEAQVALAQAQDNSSDAERALAELRRGGINDSPKVEAALERLRRANLAIADAQRNAADASRIAAGQTDEYRRAMEKLSPAGRSFVEFLLNEWQPAWEDSVREIQSELLPGVESGLRKLGPAGALVVDMLASIAGSIGDAFDELGDYFSSEQGLTELKDLLESTEKVARNLGDALGGLFKGIYYIMLGATGMTEKFTGDMADGLTGFGDSMQEAFEDGSMQKWFKRAYGIFRTVGRILGNLGETIFNVGSAANEGLGDDLLEKFDRLAQGWADMTGSEQGRQDIVDWFSDLSEPLGEVLDMVGDLLTWFAEYGTSDQFMKDLEALRELGSELGDLFETLDGDSTFNKLIRGATKVVEGLEFMIDKFGVVGTLAAYLFKGPLLQFAWFLTKNLPRAVEGAVGALGRLLGGASGSGLRGVLGTLGKFTKGAGPVGIFLTAATAIGYGFKWMYDNNLTFRTGVDYAWELLRRFGSWLKDKFNLDGLASTFEDAFAAIGDAIQSAWDKLTGFLTDAKSNLASGWDGFKSLMSGNGLLGEQGYEGANGDAQGPGFDLGLNNPFKAMGGMVRAGTPYIVGERRPEIFVPDRPGRIVPSLNNLPAGNGGGGLTEAMVTRLAEVVASKTRAIEQHNTFNTDVDPTAISAEFAWALRGA